MRRLRGVCPFVRISRTRREKGRYEEESKVKRGEGELQRATGCGDNKREVESKRITVHRQTQTLRRINMRNNSVDRNVCY